MTNYTKNLLLIAVSCLAIAGFTNKQTDFEKIRERVTRELLKPEADNSKIEQLVATLQPDGAWPGINYRDVSRTGFEHRYHLSNMVALARAYASENSKFYRKEKVKQAIESALQHWVQHDYLCDNWWHNEIGTPDALVSLMLIAGDQLEPSLVEQAQPMIRRAHVDAPGARPGGDRIKMAGIQAKNALFRGDEEQFNALVRVIEGEIKFSEWVGARYGYGFRHTPGGFANRDLGGRGIQYDYSFHHRVDGVNNTLSYGLGYAAAFTEWAAYTAGTEFAFSEEKTEQLIDYFLDGICKTAAFGKFPDPGAKNRSIARPGALRPYDASLAERLSRLSGYRKAELQEIADIRRKGIKPTLAHATYFWHSEHFSVQRPDWFASVRLYSTRTHNMEEPYNEEGLLNHHRGDGANHLTRTGDEYLDIWPVYDYQKIPGATILQKPELPAPEAIQKLGLTGFVGAATDGRYGAAAFDFRSPHDPLIARKSWFFFDDEYVCLGAGISCRNPDWPVATTLNQCRLRGEVTLAAAGNPSVPETGEQPYEQVTWVFHDSTGYLFLQPTTIHLKNGPAHGSWWRINKQTDSSKEEISLDVFQLWVDHGRRPSDASYEYIVVPATSLEEFRQNSAAENISILANEPEVQAVYHAGSKQCQAVFYQAGAVRITDELRLTCETPGIVLLQTLPSGAIRLTVADPNRELGAMYLSVSKKLEKTGEHFRAVWNEVKKESEIIIELPEGQYAGSSVSITL